MSKALKCDRCGKLYEMYHGIPLTPEGNAYHALTLIDQNYARRHFDMCPECMQQIIYFLNNEGDTYLQCRDCKHEKNGINDTPCVSCKRINNGPEYDTDYYEYDEKKEGE